MAATKVRAEAGEPASVEHPFPRGAPLRVKPILIYDVPTRKDRTSWRGYGGIHTPQAAHKEAGRIKKELVDLKQRAEFPIQLQSVELFTRLDTFGNHRKVKILRQQ